MAGVVLTSHMLIFTLFVDLVVKVRFGLLVRLSRRMGAGFHGPGVLLVGAGLG